MKNKRIISIASFLLLVSSIQAAQAAPSAPLNVATASASAAGASTSSAAITVTWDRPSSYSDIVGYIVRATSPGQSTVTSSIVPNASVSSYSSTLSGLTGGSTYSVAVSSEDSFGALTAATSVSITAQSVPSSPVPVSATAGVGKIDLVWTAPTNNGGSSITGYTISATGITDKSAAASATTYSVTGLTAGASYTFTIVATNALGSSVSGSFTSTTVLSVTSKPLNVSASLLGSDGISVSWSAPTTGASTVTSYTATLRDAATQVAIAGKTSTVSGATSTSFTSLTAGSYVVTVVATNDVGDSDASDASRTVTVNSSSLTDNTPVFSPTSLNDVVPGSTQSLQASAPNPNESPSLTPNGNCSYNDGTKIVTATGAAGSTCTVTATTAGDGTYATGSATISFAIKNANVITFGSITDKTLPVSPFALTPTASSGLTVTLASTTLTICTVSSLTVTILLPGTCTLRATQLGNSTTLTATPVAQSFTVTKGTQNLTFTSIPTKTLPASDVTLTAISSVVALTTFTYSSSTPTICGVSGSTLSFLAAGSCIVTASQAGNNDYAAATASQTITVNAAAVAAAGGGGGGPAPSPSPSASATASASPSPSASATASASPSPSRSASPTPSPSPTPKPSSTPTPTQNPTPTSSVSATPTASTNTNSTPLITISGTAKNYLSIQATNSKNISKLTLNSGTTNLNSKVGKNISIVIPAIKKGTAVSIKVKLPNGSSATLNNIKSSETGKLTIPPLKFSKPGNYTIKLIYGSKTKIVNMKVLK